MKYGLTSKEQKLLNRALTYQQKATEAHMRFTESLADRFPNSATAGEFEEWDLWTLNESGDSSFDENIVSKFWQKVRKENETNR